MLGRSAVSKYPNNPEVVRFDGSIQRGMASQGGMVLPLVAAGAVALFGFMALAIDVGHVMVVKAELQNAADAAALAGANNIYPLQNNGQFNAQSVDVALESIKMNKANGEIISADNATMEQQPGYVTVADTSTLTPTSFTQSMAPGADVTTQPDAFRVRISKPAVASVFGRVVGFMSFSPEATSMAGLPSGFSQVNSGADGLFPLAMNKCLYDTYWSGNKPLTDNGNAITFCIAGKDAVDCNDKVISQSQCETDGVESGTWTSFTVPTDKKSPDNGTKAVKDLIASRNTSNLKIDVDNKDNGDDFIHLQPGERNVLYSIVNDCSAAGDKSCEYVVLPVVDWKNSDSINGKTLMPIKAFACVHIISAGDWEDKSGKNKDVKKVVIVQLMPPRSKQCRFKSVVTDMTKVWSNNSYGLTATPILIH